MNVEASYDTFLSYDRRDSDLAARIANDLTGRGLRVFFDQCNLKPGVPWPQALEAALSACAAVTVVVGAQEMGPWQSREVSFALDRQTRDPDVRVIPVLLPGAEGPLGFLGLQTWVDFRAGIEDHGMTVLSQAIRAELTDPSWIEQMQATRGSVSPYRGLRPFREEDASLFFGREAFTHRLAEVTSRQGFVAVVGPSGSGKSSVVRAGLVPQLRRPDSGARWDILSMVPGRFPVRALAAAMLSKLEPEMGPAERLREVPRLAEGLIRRDVSLGDVAKAALAADPGTNRLLLVVDQWEELYTITEDPADRELFIQSIMDASAADALTVVVTMRGDFYGKAIANRQLADRLQQGVVNLSTMTRSELQSAIVKPAGQVGLRLEAGLEARILDEVGEEPGNLPLLEFVLDELWLRRSDDRLTMHAYDAMGGLRGAIAQRAEDTVTPEHREQARQVFLRLVEPGVDAPDTRRRATLTEIGSEAAPTIRRLADARLIVTNRDDTTDELTVEVAHEVLIDGWERLRNWIAEDRDFLLWRSRLAIAVAAWKRANRDDGALMRGGPLGESERWLDERSADLTAEEQDFISHSRDAANRGRRRVIAILAAGLAFFALLAGAASAIALDQRNDAIAAFGEVAKSQQQVNRLQSEADTLNASVRSAQSQLAQAESNLAVALDEATVQQGELARLYELLDQTGVEVDQALQDLDSANAGRTQAETELATALAERDAAQAALEQAERNLADAQNNLDAATSDLAALNQDIDNREERLSTVRAEIDRACERLADARDLGQVDTATYTNVCQPLLFLIGGILEPYQPPDGVIAP